MAEERDVVLGVDGGGTSTTCVALRVGRDAGPAAPLDGGPRVAGRGVASGSNANSVGEEAARTAVVTAMMAALVNGRLPQSAVRGVCLALAGVDRPADIDRVTGWMRKIFPANVDIHVQNDAVAALASGTGGSPYGCVLIAGTGTIAVGYSRDGRNARASGAGPLLGDRGSGYAIASEALTAIMKEHDGRGPRTMLTQLILSHLQLSTPADIIGWVYEDQSWARVAALSPLVRRAAAAGDFEAQRILEEAVQELTASVAAVEKALQLSGPDNSDPYPLVLVGGLLEDTEAWNISQALLKYISRCLPAARPIKPMMEPAEGAALLAFFIYQGKVSLSLGLHKTVMEGQLC
eukprot:SM000036S13308  [mRNA]  locus=s36:510769:513261:+ [translate_table: standard]